jgi:MFS family permease
MKAKVLISSSLFHLLNDASTVAIPMIFPLLYNQRELISRYTHIGILSYAGMFLTFLCQILVARNAHRFEYRSVLFTAFTGLSLSIFLISFSSTFAMLFAFYLFMRIFASFYHSIGVATVSRTHADRSLDFAMGVQSGSGNVGILIAFITVGYLAEKFGWQQPLVIWAAGVFMLGSIAFFLLRRINLRNPAARTPKWPVWSGTFKKIGYTVPGIVLGGSSWATTVYFAPSLLNHRLDIPLGKTGIYMAAWIFMGTITPYLFGYLSRKLGRRLICWISLTGTTLGLYGLFLSRTSMAAVISLLFFGMFMLLLFPILQTYIGDAARAENQDVAFTLFANVQMLSGAAAGLIGGLVSDALSIQYPFLILAVLGTLTMVGYAFLKPFKIGRTL